MKGTTMAATHSIPERCLTWPTVHPTIKYLIDKTSPRSYT